MLPPSLQKPQGSRAKVSKGEAVVCVLRNLGNAVVYIGQVDFPGLKPGRRDDLLMVVDAGKPGSGKVRCHQIKDLPGRKDKNLLFT